MADHIFQEMTCLRGLYSCEQAKKSEFSFSGKKSVKCLQFSRSAHPSWKAEHLSMSFRMILPANLNKASRLPLFLHAESYSSIKHPLILDDIWNSTAQYSVLQQF